MFHRALGNWAGCAINLPVVGFAALATLATGCSAETTRVPGPGQSVASTSEALASVSPPFNQCPAVGQDSSCRLLLLAEDQRTIRVLTDETQGAFDGIEDTLVGVQNNSSVNLLHIPLHSTTDMFGFDGDGLCAGYSPSPTGCPFGPTGYEGVGSQGQKVTYSNITADRRSGVVNFEGGLKPGDTAYFSLEEAIQTVCTNVKDVPLLHQFDGSWGCNIYDSDSDTALTDKPWCTGGPKYLGSCKADADCQTGGADTATCCTKSNTLRHWGCHVTSAAMVINHFAIAQGSQFTTTPALLNTWLTENHGFDTANGPLPTKVVEYAKNNGVIFYPGQTVTNRDDLTVNQFLCNGDPVILRVKRPHGPHFVVATAQTAVGGQDTYAINDPGFNGVDSLASYNFDYDEILPFTSIPHPLNTFYVRGHSPFELVLKDDAGHETGVHPGSNAVEDIPGSAFYVYSLADDEDPDADDTTSPEKNIDVFQPQPGHYRLDAVGTGSGPFSIEFIAVDGSGVQQRIELSGQITPGATISYDIDYRPGQTQFLSVTPVNQPPTVLCHDASPSVDASCHATVAAADIDAGSSDPDGDVITCGVNPTGPFGLGSVPVALTCSDPKAASNSCTATVTAVDRTPPTLVAPADRTVASCFDSSSVNVGRATATDNCAQNLTPTGKVIATNGVPLAKPIPVLGDHVTLGIGKHTVRWTVSDGVTLPVTADQTVVVGAVVEVSQSFMLDDRAQLQDEAGGFTAILNAGSGITRVGNDARSGAVISKGPVSILHRARIAGNVLSSGTVSSERDSVVTGTITSGTPVALPPLPALPTFPPATLGSLTVNSGSTRSIPPGSYVNVTVNGGTLVLGAGDYFFASLIDNSGSIVRATATTRVFVRDNLVYNSPILAASGTAIQPIVLGFAGSLLNLSAKFDGTLIAPNAVVNLGSGSGLVFVGSFFARVIELTPASTLVCKAG